MYIKVDIYGTDLTVYVNVFRCEIYKREYISSDLDVSVECFIQYVENFDKAEFKISQSTYNEITELKKSIKELI